MIYVTKYIRAIFARPIQLHVFATSSNSDTRRKTRLYGAVSFYILSLGCALLLFNNYSILFTSQRLLSANPYVLITLLVEPVIYLALCVYFLALGIAMARSIIPIVLIPIIFFLNSKLSLNSFFSSLLIGAAFWFFYYQFTKSFYELKKPTLAKALNSSLGLFIIFISLAISLNYYADFSSRVGRLSTRLGIAASQKFGFIANDFDSESTPVSQQETLRTHAINSLVSRNTPINEKSIAQKERSILNGLDLTAASPNSNYKMLLDKAIKKQVSITVSNYHKLLLIVVPFAFFFVTDVLANVSVNVTWALLECTEFILRRKAVFKN